MGMKRMAPTSQATMVSHHKGEAGAAAGKVVVVVAAPGHQGEGAGARDVVVARAVVAVVAVVVAVAAGVRVDHPVGEREAAPIMAGTRRGAVVAVDHVRINHVEGRAAVGPGRIGGGKEAVMITALVLVEGGRGGVDRERWRGEGEGLHCHLYRVKGIVESAVLLLPVGIGSIIGVILITQR